ncbi:MAG: hypothetical protein EBZ36_02075 [Acidobacteria bacterium]|nr:hypothetical protein [Acidobacteriota bacterium]
MPYAICHISDAEPRVRERVICFTREIESASWSFSMGYYKVAMVSDLPATGGLQVRLGQDQIAIFRHGEDGTECHAINDLCPHRGAPLSEGYLESDRVLCPWHCFDFNLCTGESTIAPHLRVTTYPVRIDENGTVEVLYPDDLAQSSALIGGEAGGRE